jgi:type IV secretion system protein VirB4
LDGVLTDDDFIGGLYPRLGKDFLRTVSIRSYPSSSSPGLLDRLNALGASYRWVSRFLPLDKEDARAELNVIRKRWFAKRKGVLGLLKEAVTREPAALEDSDALAKAEDADDALVILGGDAATMGYFTPTVTVTDPDPIELEKKVRDVEAVINRAGFVAKVEDVNAVEAWLGSLPGHAYADRRRPMISTLNLCDALPLNAIWSGPTINAHLTAELSKLGTMDVQPPLAYAKAAGSTPFRLDLHRGDVGHTMVIGPTGSGKSVFLNLIAMQWLRYPRAQIIFFDKGASSRAATLLVGGAYFALGAAASELAFQPLGALDTAKDLTWAQEWLLDLISGEGVETSAEMKREIWMTLQNLAAGPRDQRTLSMFAATIQNRSIKEAVKRFTLEGPYGHLLDADVDFLSQARWLTFEMNELFSARDAVAPTLTHIFHQIEQRFDGRPTLLIIDEAWVFLDNSRFAAKIREWLKTLRKSNVAVIFATQSLSDVARASIAPALIESCPTKIFLPNSDAYTSTISDLYRSFGLTDAQIKIIGQSTPKRDYYFQSSSGNRLFELGLGPATLATVGASSANDQKMIDDLLEAHGEHGFAAAYFRACGLDWASRHIEEARP